MKLLELHVLQWGPWSLEYVVFLLDGHPLLSYPLVPGWDK
jgi:hypothetical protein